METETTTLSLKEQFDNINLDELPESIRFELETIQEETADFSDEDALPVWEKNFKFMYFSIKQKYPAAMKDYVAPEPEVIPEPELSEEAKKALEIANKYKKK